MIIQSKDDHPFSLIGLPFLLDGVQGSSSVLIRNSQSECISMHITVNKLPEEPPTFSCRQNHSIIAVIQISLGENSGDLQSPSKRINIWHNLKTQMVAANLPDSHLNLELDQAFLVESKPNFLSSLFVLAQANSENRKLFTPNEESIKLLFFIWKIGCSYLDDSALQVLSKVENKFKGNPSIVEWLGPAGSLEEAKLLDWMVGEYKPVPKPRIKRQALQGYQPIYPSRTAGAVSEASGLSPTDIRQPKYPTSNPNAAILVQPVLPIEITVQQISNFQIPPNTFRSPDGSRLQLRLFEHIYPMQFGIDFKDPSAATGREIISDSSSWISFDSATEILRLRPFLEHEGTHKFVLCAYNMLSSRTCTNINVRVKPPMPIKKSFAVNVAPVLLEERECVMSYLAPIYDLTALYHLHFKGIYWCYTIPLYWFDELKVHSIADVEFHVTGEGFSWDAAKGEICIVTTLQREEIKVFFFRAVHRVTAETVEIELRIAVKVPPTVKIISSPRFRLRLRWMHTYNNYEMLEIARLNLSLTQALRVRVNPSVIPQNLFIYDVLQIRKFQEKDSSPLSKVLEIEFIYLPLNIPNPGSANYLNILNDHGSSNYWVSGVSYGLTTENKQLYQLKGLCENARLSGAVSAIQAAAESFRPFLLESVAEVDLPDSACSKILQMFGGNMDSNRIYPPPLTTTNIPYSDQVIENFTVEAGLAFRKRINPSRVVPMNRIRSLEIIDENYNRLNDTAWITVAEDKTNLFGLPLQNHARKDAYRFWLSILTVDQRTPLNIHFTVDVVKWPLEMTTARGRFAWHPQPIAILNHRVRMRMKLGGTVGRGISPTYNWPPTSPENSLSYRWNLVTNLDKYLRSECGPHCGVGIMLVDIQRQDQSVIQVEWAMLPVLQEGLRDGLLNSSYGGTQAPACPQRSIQELQRKLLKVPLYNRFSSLSSSAPTPHQEYFAETELRQASWSAPAPQLVEHLDWARIGTVSVIAVDLIGSCFSPYWKGDVTAKQSDFLDVLNITTYIGETFRYPITSDSKCFQSPSPTARLYDKDLMEVNETSWLGLDAGKCAIFGVVMKSIVTTGLHEFRIMLSPASSLLSRVIILVGERNPRLPEVPNHRVLMRFEPGFAVRADPRTHILQTLIRKWQFLVTLDEYLRPKCQKAGRYVCSSDMDILIISVAPDDDVLNVIWAKKSLVYNSRLLSSGPYNNKYKSRSHRALNYGDIPVPRLPDPQLSCPWNELEELTLQLQTSVSESRIQPELQRRFQQAGFSRLIDVKVERLGKCAEQSKPFITGRSLTVITMPPLPSTLNRRNLRAHKTADNDNVVQGLSKKDWNWNWKWDYSDLYEANGDNNSGQKDSIDLSTESPFYFMEFYGQDRINEVSKRPPVNSYPNYTSQLPNTGYINQGLATPTTSTIEPETIQKPPNPQTQQRTFLITALLPICILIVILLAVALAIVWYLKFRGGTTGRSQQKLDNEGGRAASGNIDGTSGERVPLKEDKKSEGKKNGLTIANNGSQVTNKTPKKSIGNLKDLDNLASPPSKPLIFPNEKPPLKPPDLMTPMAKSAIDPPLQPRLASTDSPNTRHFFAMGQRPDPYRNLPPPIDTRFGLPRQMTSQYGPYRRDHAL